MMAEMNDPFASVRLKPTGQQRPQQMSQQSQESQEDPFSTVRIKKAEGFPWLYETGRHAARTASRIAETIGGIPGDISSLIQSGVFAGLEKLVGQEVTPEMRKKAKEFSEVPPTTKELKEFSEEQTQGFTAPQNEIEKIGDEFVSTAASLFGPMKFRKALGVALGAQSAKEGLKLLGVGEKGQEAGKFGTMLLMTMFNPGGALRYASSQYEKANALAKGISVSAPTLEKNLTSLVKDLEKGVTTTSKNAVIKPAEEILAKINKGKIPVHDLTAAKRDLNTLMKDPLVLTREKKLLKVVGKEIDDAIKPFEKLNPKFKEAYRPANEIYGAVMQGTKASDFIRRTLGVKSVLGSVAGEIALGHPEYVVPTLSGVAAAVGSARTLDFFTRLAKSPELQKYYAKAMAAAIAEDAPALRLYADKLENSLGKD